MKWYILALIAFLGVWGFGNIITPIFLAILGFIMPILAKYEHKVS